MHGSCFCTQSKEDTICSLLIGHIYWLFSHYEKIDANLEFIGFIEINMKNEGKGILEKHKK